jgi:hypothetical protein
MNDDQGHLIEEYKLLREEIMRRQYARLVVLGFTVAGIGTVIGLTLGNNSVAVQGLNYYALALISFALAMLTAALLLTIHHTQQIDIISAYIRKYIEPKVSGIQWESRWTRYRESMHSNPKACGLPLGTSKPLAFYYGFLTAAVYSVSFVTGLHNYLPALTVVSILAIISLACSFDLYKRKTKGWKINWDVIDKPH